MMQKFLRWFNRVTLWLVLGFYAAYTLYIVNNAMQNPYYNWDMIAYVGSAIKFEESNPENIYALMKEDVLLSVPRWVTDQYFKLDHQLSGNANAFYHQLPFYDGKILYLCAMWLMHFLGFYLSHASWLLSSICFVGLMGALACWRPFVFDYRLWLLSIIGLCEWGSWPMKTLAFFSTPDALYTMLLAFSLVSIKSRRPLLISTIISMFAILTRPDAIFTSGVIVSVAASMELFRDRKSLKSCLIHWGLAVSSLLLVYGLIKYFNGGYGWSAYFQYLYIKLPSAMEKNPAISWEFYRSVFAPNMYAFSHSMRVWFYAVLCALAFVAGLFLRKSETTLLAMLVLTLAAFAVRFALYPWWEDRYYYGYCILLLAASVDLISKVLVLSARNIRIYKMRTT